LIRRFKNTTDALYFFIYHVC